MFSEQFPLVDRKISDLNRCSGACLSTRVRRGEARPERLTRSPGGTLQRGTSWELRASAQVKPSDSLVRSFTLVSLMKPTNSAIYTLFNPSHLDRGYVANTTAAASFAVAVVVFATSLLSLLFTAVTAVAGLHCRRCSSPLLLSSLAAIAVAAALALGQISSSPRFYCSPLPTFVLAKSKDMDIHEHYIEHPVYSFVCDAPLVGTLDQRVHCVFLCLIPVDNMVSKPVHPVASFGTGPMVVVLGIVRVKEFFSVPRHPTVRLDQISDGRFHDDGPRVCLPWPAYVVAEL
ncbi:hypothetical protein B296_00019049 [Ensete ventricosum]|uniref:Uncharacterized protein n=1 Tax=Ensete ventricosum TaxID=4639 RepID=A0A427AAH3_ENSVE|nr:hypothetical protein B296_00019049 [Ensete ventricosum]